MPCFLFFILGGNQNYDDKNLFIFILFTVGTVVKKIY